MGGILDGFVDGGIDDFVVDDAGHYTALALAQAFDGGYAESAGEDPIKIGGAATALDMAQDGDLHFVAIKLFSHFAGNFVGPAFFIPLGNDDKSGAFVVGTAFFENFDQGAEVGFGFGNQNLFASCGNAPVKGNVAGIPAHDLNKEEPVVGIRGIPDFVDAFHHRVGGGIKADGIIGAVEVVIDGSRQAYHGYGVFLRKDVGTPEAPITAHDDQGLDIALGKVLVGFAAAFRGAELLGAGGFEDGTPPVYDIPDGSKVHGAEFVLNQAIVAPYNPPDPVAVVDTTADQSPDTGIHARGISP